MSNQKTFAVYVVDRRQVKYFVDAASAEEAREKVEASGNADEDFGGKDINAEWYVDDVQEV